VNHDCNITLYFAGEEFKKTKCHSC